MCKFHLYVYMFLLYFSSFVITIGLWLLVTDLTDTTYTTHLILFIGIGLHSLTVSFILLSQQIIFGEACGNLCVWTKILSLQIIEADMTLILKKYFHECSKLYCGLKMTSQIFSQQLGVILCFCLGALIFIFYRFLAFFIGNYHFSFSLTIFVIGFGGISLFMIYFLLFDIIVSQYVIDEVKYLTVVLESLPVQENQMVFINNENYPAMYVRNLMVKKLESFVGFDAGGFVTLNKGLISGITANFITYLIVLIQFKTSEISSKMTQ